MTSSRGALLAHPLNLLLLSSAALSAAWTGDWRPLAVGAVAEAVWWMIGPASARRRAAAARRTRVDQTEQERLRTLGDALRRRYLELDRVRADIRRLVGANPDLQSVGIDRELAKVDALVEGWLRLASGAAHMRAIVDDTDVVDLEVAAMDASGDRKAELEARLADARAARQGVAESETELTRVEEQLRGLRDRIVSMSAPSALGASLDDLIGGVDAAERAVRDLQSLSADPKASARRAATRQRAGEGP